jgi:putative membrane protein insertion efficiency factor
MRSLALGTIRAYQIAMSPYLPGVCRHTPTCSEYAYQAISKYGLLRGVWLGVRRLGRCRPMGTSGFDPLP